VPEIKVCEKFHATEPMSVGAANMADLPLSFAPCNSPHQEGPMHQPLDSHRLQPQRGLTPTARLVLLYLDQVPGGARVEDIAANTGSKYRWVEATVQRLNKAGLLHRVGPNMYAIANQAVSA
jgi:hypothetical protein